MKAFALLLLACAGSAGAATPEPERVVVRPKEIDEVLVNPGMGFTTFQSFEGDPISTGSNWPEGYPALAKPGKGSYPKTSVAYIRIYWNVIEPEEGKPRWELVGEALAKAASRGQTLMLRLVPYGDQKEAGTDVPAWYRKKTGSPEPKDLRPPLWRIDQANEEFAKSWGALIRELAKRYDGHSALEAVDVSFVGPWGEGAGTSKIPASERNSLFDAYLSGFKRTPLLAQPWDWAEGEKQKGPVGFRLDCVGDVGGFSPNWSHMYDLYPQEIVKSGLRDSWTERPVSLEACWVMGEWKKRKFDLDYIIEQSLKWHVSTFNAKSSSVPKDWRPKVDRWLKKMGHRLVLRRFEFPKVASHGKAMEFSSWWENKGVAPPYRKYRIALRLRSKAAEWIQNADADLTKWVPGDQLADGKLELPRDLPPGDHELALAIVEGNARAPVVRLAIAGRAPDGWYPLGKISIKNVE